MDPSEQSTRTDPTNQHLKMASKTKHYRKSYPDIIMIPQRNTSAMQPGKHTQLSETRHMPSNVVVVINR